MTRGITQNYWRFNQPEAPNLKYGCLPDGKVYVSLRQELTQGVRPFDEIVTASNLRQMGYFCDYVVDVPCNDGVIHMDEDGRGFWYVPQKGYTGEDVLSYRIVNIMNQTSEPGCITFIVDHNQKPERIEDVIEKIKTTILQDADADYWVETNEERKVVKEREVYAYNTVPEQPYVLAISGTWSAKYKTWHTWWSGSNPVSYFIEHTYSGVVKPVMLDMRRTVNFADYDVFKFTAAIDDATIGMPKNWPTHTAVGDYPLYDVKFNVGIQLVPIGDIRRTAESSNYLMFIEDDFATYPREISDKTRDRLADKSTYFAQLSPEIKKPIFLINGRESVALNRAIRAGRTLDATGKTKDPVNDVGLMVQVVDQSYFDPVYNSVNVNTSRNRLVGYDIGNGPEDTRVAGLTFTLADVPAVGGTFALVVDLPDLTSVYNIPDFEPKFLDRDFDNSFIAGFDYKGLLVLEVFETPVSGSLLATGQFNITRKLSSNVEYITSRTTCLDADGNLEFYPIDLSKVRGFIVVPFSDKNDGQTANAKLLSSNYIPITSSATNTYPALSNTTKQAAFYGSVVDGIPPAIHFPNELLKWGLTPRIAPDMTLHFLRETGAKISARWRLVPVTHAITNDADLALLCEDHRKNSQAEWVNEREYRDLHSLIAYENWVNDADRGTLHKSAYPEVVTLRRLTQYDHAGIPGATSNSTTEFVAVLDLERTDDDVATAHLIELFAHDALTNRVMNSSRVNFDTPEKRMSLAYAYVAVINGVAKFAELQKGIEFTTTPPSPPTP